MNVMKKVKDFFDMHPELDHPGAKDAMRGDTTAGIKGKSRAD